MKTCTILGSDCCIDNDVSCATMNASDFFSAADISDLAATNGNDETKKCE